LLATKFHQPHPRSHLVSRSRLVEVLSKEAAAKVHREVHGLEADEIIEVQEGR